MSDEILPEIFADGISNIEISNGMIRVDFYSLSGESNEAKGELTKTKRQRVVMSPQGFLDSFSTMQSMFQKLEEAGILKRQSGDGENSGVDAKDEPKKRSAPKKAAAPKSPNFS